MFLTSMFKRKSTQGSGPIVPNMQLDPVRQVLAFGGNQNFGQARMKTRDYASYLRACTIPNVYSAASVIAYNVAACKYRVLDGEGKVVDIEHVAPDLWQLLKQPNPQFTGFQYREGQAYDILLTGNHFGALDSWAGDKPTELWRLRPDRLQINISPYGIEYGLCDEHMQPIVTYSYSEMLHDRMFNPFDAIWGLGIIEAGEVVFSRDRLINELLRGYFERGAILEGVLTLDNSLTQTEYNRMLTNWRALKEGAGNKMKTAILYDGAKYEAIQEPLGNIPIVDLAKLSRNEVFELFGVPPQKVGDFGSSNYRNSQEADAFFWQETMTPLLVRLEPSYTTLVKLWNDEWVFTFDVKSVPADFANQAKAVQLMAQTGVYSRNQLLVITGHEPYEDDLPIGEQLISTSPTFTVVGTIKDPTPLAREPRPASSLADNDQEEDEDDDTGRGSSTEITGTGSGGSAS